MDGNNFGRRRALGTPACNQRKPDEDAQIASAVVLDDGDGVEGACRVVLVGGKGKYGL